MSGTATKWTDEQSAAINHRDGGAIVTAGAGSGKTAVLTRRVIDMICDPENPIDPSKAAIVTFTEKAAGELKTRLGSLMRAEMAKGGDKAFLRSQNIKLKSARISTISAFCFSLIRENIELSELAAGFSVLDESKAVLMKKAVCDAVMEEFYATAPKDSVELLLASFVGKDDKMLCDMIITAQSFMNNLVSPEKWVEECRLRHNVKALERSMRYAAESAWENICGYSEDLLDILSDELNEITDKMRQKMREINDVLLANAQAVTESGYNLETVSLSPVPKTGNVTNIDLKFAYKSLKDSYDRLLEYCRKLEQLEEAQQKCLPASDLFFELLCRFDKRYTDEKRALNVADFSDAERGLYNMLVKNPMLREKIGLQLIIVDEFQDSNALQYEIFSRLSDGLKNLYFVGDIKQSIYSFRGAQPEVFDAVSHDDGNFTALPLTYNFRSSPEVIDGINDIFDSIMTKGLGGVDYRKEGRLVCGKGGESRPENITEVVAVTCDKDEINDTAAEALYIAGRIRAMLDSGYKIGDRVCKESDFAIIMRAPKNKVADYTAALKLYGLGANTSIGENFCERPEITLMLDYLRVIDNPYNDECLARVLMSAVYGCTAEEMARIRTGTCGFDLKTLKELCFDELKAYCTAYQKKPLFACVNSAARGYEIYGDYPKLAQLFKEHPEYFGSLRNEKCDSFVQTLYRLRSVMACNPPSQLIKCIYDTTQTLSLLMLAQDAQARNANLSLLIQYAQQYENGTSGAILSDFLDNLDETVKRGKMLNAAQTNGADGVNVMSIHASKGLQFPVVFVADCAKTFNYRDTYADILFSEEYGICLKITDKQKMSKLTTPTYEFTAEKMKQKLRSEEMRLLYVAATRAEQKLIFTGANTKGIGDYYSTNDTFADCSASSYLAWLLQASKPLPKVFGQDVYDSFTAGAVRYSQKYVSPLSVQAEKEEAPVSPGGDCGDVIAQQITREYSYPALTRIAAKYTATQLCANRRIIEGSSEKCDLYVGMPDFMNEDSKGLSGKRKGDAYHKLMEHIPFDRQLTENEIADYIENRTDSFLSGKEKQCIKPLDIKAFFDTDIAQRMIKSGRVYREYPIFHKLDVSMLTAAELGVCESDDYSAAEPYIQGIADMFFIEDDGIVLIDYKSDSFSDEERLIEDYQFQLMLYKQALTAAFDMPVKEMYIYSFRLRKMIQVKQ